MDVVVQKHISPLHKVFFHVRDEDAPIDLAKLPSAFTLQAFAEIGYGVEMDCLTPDKEHPSQHAFDNATRSVMTRFFRPRWFWKLQRWLGVGEEGNLRHCKKVMDSVGMEVILKSIDTRRKSGGGSKSHAAKDVVSLFLDSADENPDLGYLKDIVLAFLFAGHALLVFHDGRQAPEGRSEDPSRDRNEAPDLFHSKEVGAAPNMDQVQELTYLEAAMKESLRLNPIVSLNDRAVEEDLVLCDGTRVLFPAYALFRMESVWGPDALEFKPERWIDPNTGGLIQVSSFKYPVLHGGPRQCLSVKLALLEMKIVAASLLSTFRLSVLPNQRVVYDMAIMMVLKGTVLVGVENVPGSAQVA